MAQLRNLFFDVGNTLLFPDWEVTLAPLHRRQIAPGEDLLRETERRTKREFDPLQEDGRADHGFWHLFYGNLLSALKVDDVSLRAELIAAIRVSANWRRIRPGTRELLLALRDKYRLAVISNADGHIDAVLERCGIADCFLTITDSGIVGGEKPHPAIFEAALRSIDAEPQESLYVGDVYSVDYVGATAAGMQAVLFDVCAAYKDKGVARVGSLEELLQWLELTV